MKITPIVSLVSAVCSTLALAAESDPTAGQLQGYPKNLARQHLGSNLFVFNATNQTYVPTEAAAAWLDDDVTTGWPAMAGKQYYLLALPEPELVSNFSVSSRPANGTITIYAGDEPGAPGAKTWTPLAKDVAFNSINERKLAKSFSRFAKYVLIETDIADPGPVYSLYLFGEKPASAYSLRKREQPIDSRGIFGPYTNGQTAFNLSGLYAQSRVVSSNSGEGFVAAQKAIDDNAESGLTIAGSTNESGAVIKYGGSQSISRIALLADGNAKGKLDFFAVSAPATATAAGNDATFLKANNPPATGEAASTAAVSLEGKIPTISIVLDGSNPRTSIDFPAVQADMLLVRWSPVVPTDSLNIREFNSFGKLDLDNYEVGLKPEAVAEWASRTGGEGKGGKDSKEIAEGPRDPKDPKITDEVAAGPNPYLPGALGFPPNLNNRGIPGLSRVSNPSRPTPQDTPPNSPLSP